MYCFEEFENNKINFEKFLAVKNKTLPLQSYLEKT
jgi:hypothetical protein